MNKKTKIFFKILMVFNPRGTSLYNMQKHWIPTKRNWTQASKRNIIPGKKIIGSTTLEDQLRTGNLP